MAKKVQSKTAKKAKAKKTSTKKKSASKAVKSTSKKVAKKSTTKKAKVTKKTSTTAKKASVTKKKTSAKKPQSLTTQGKASKAKAAKKPSRASVKAQAEIDALTKKWLSLQKKSLSKGLKAETYNIKKQYEARTPLSHGILGWGFIMSNVNDRLEVLFEDGIKHLISNRH